MEVYLEGRNVLKTNLEKFLPYNRYGKNINRLSWLPLSGGNRSENEIYMIHFEPESRSNFHMHKGSEEFFVVDGELIDDDGKKFKKGDFVRFEPGTKHSSFSERGCTLLVILSGGKNQLIE